MKHVLVSGASGLLGSAVVNSLLSKGWQVTALARTPWQGGSQAGLMVIPFDLARDALNSLPADTSAVVHCAAYVPSAFNNAEAASTLLQVNGLGTLRLLTWAREVGAARFVNCSSYSLYQRPVPFPIPEHHPLYPTGHATYYAVSKLVAEVYASSMNTDGFSVCSLRFSSLYGPGMKASGVLHNFVDLARRGATFEVKSDPNSLFDFLYVDDAVTAISLCLTKATSFTVYNVGAGRGVTLPDLARTCWAVFGPPSPLAIHCNASATEPSHTVVDITRAQHDIGYEPAFDLSAGLHAMKQRMSA